METEEEVILRLNMLKENPEENWEEIRNLEFALFLMERNKDSK